MAGVAQALRNQTPLYREAFATINRATLIDRPADRAVVDDQVLTLRTAQAVGIASAVVADTEAQVAHDDIAGANRHREAGDADALTRSSLSCYGEVALGDAQRRVEEDRARYVEDYRARSLLFEGVA